MTLDPQPLPDPCPDPQRRDEREQAGQNENCADLVIPGEITVGDQKVSDIGTSGGPMTRGSSPQSPQVAGKNQEVVLTPDEMATLVLTAKMIRSRYDQSEAPKVITSLVRKCVAGELPKAQWIEVNRLGLRWDNWARELLIETERLIAIRAATKNN